MSEKWEDGYYFCNECEVVFHPEEMKIMEDGIREHCPDCNSFDVDYFKGAPGEDNDK